MAAGTPRLLSCVFVIKTKDLRTARADIRPDTVNTNRHASRGILKSLCRTPTLFPTLLAVAGEALFHSMAEPSLHAESFCYRRGGWPDADLAAVERRNICCIPL